ncbi:MAG: trigger factor [Lachnospiraceae bacterium]|nr:trigger factor [Lachnospiraceae bacterium]
MKKNILAILMVIMFAAMMAGCGNSDTSNPEQNESEQEQEQDTDQPDENADDGEADTDEPAYLTDFNAGDYVTLGQYKGVEVEVAAPVVTEESVDEYLEYVLSAHAGAVPVTDRSAQSGDIVNIDFEGKLDGVAFDGGSAQGFELTIGAGGFIDGFEDAIIGMEIGEMKDADLRFPDPYPSNPDLADKDVVFSFTLNSISEQVVPELTDEFVEDLGIEGCTTVEDYRKFIYDGLTEQAQAAFEEEKTSAAIAAVEENTTFETAPDGMIKRMNETLTDSAFSYAQMYGMSTGEYVAAVYGGTADTYEDVLWEEAAIMAQRYLMIGAIADEEGIVVTDEELDEILADEAEMFGFEDVEEYKEELDVEAYREYLLVQKVVEFLAENAVAKEPVLD